jgi:hypothetical protein
MTATAARRMFKLQSSTTTATYAVDGGPTTELPDMTLGNLDWVTGSLFFTPTEVAVCVNWTTGLTVIELTGPRTRDEKSSGWHRITLGHYGEGHTSEYQIVRDVVSQVVTDHAPRKV